MKKHGAFFVINRILVSFAAMIFLISVSSVLAVWKYAQAALSESVSVGVTLSEFLWTPEELLPSDTPGENHVVLLGEILENIKVGLNASKDTLEQAVNQYGTLYSQQKIQGGTLKHLLASSDTANLEFVMEYVSDSEYFLYTFSDDALLAGTVDITQITVYRTTLEKESGTWKTVAAAQGYSTIRTCPTGDFSIDPAEWTPGEIPAN